MWRIRNFRQSVHPQGMTMHHFKILSPAFTLPHFTTHHSRHGGGGGHNCNMVTQSSRLFFLLNHKIETTLLLKHCKFKRDIRKWTWTSP